MDSDLLRVLCALATFAIPLAVAWLLAGRAPRPAKAPERATEAAERHWRFRADL